MTHTLFTHGTIMSRAGAPTLVDGFVHVAGDTIRRTGSMADCPQVEEARVIDCSGKLLMPGLVNGHNHCAMTLFRGLADDLALADWLHNHIFPAEQAHVSREMVYWCSRLAAAEMLLSGTTTVADAYFFSGEAARGLADCGMRAVVGHGIVDFPAPSVPDPAKNIEAVEEFIKQWQGQNPLISPAVFAHAPYTCSPQTLRRAKELADRYGVRFFTHLAESEREAEMIIDPRAATPLGHLAALSLLDANAVLIHAVWLSAPDLDLLADLGAHVVTCPQSNLKLASGIAPVAAMQKRGISVGLGTDGSGSNNSLDMFREMDMLAKLHKVHGADATCLPAQAVLAAATDTGARILGLKNVGRLEAGMKADLIVIDLARPHLCPFHGPDLLVYAASGSDVESVMINGRMVVEQREITGFDYQQTRARVLELAGAVVSRIVHDNQHQTS